MKSSSDKSAAITVGVLSAKAVNLDVNWLRTCHLMHSIRDRKLRAVIPQYDPITICDASRPKKETIILLMSRVS